MLAGLLMAVAKLSNRSRLLLHGAAAILVPMDQFGSYLRELEKNLRRGVATEHTHRPALKSFIESFDKGVTAFNEPKQVECGAPDYIIFRKDIPVGHIEAKDVDKDLDAVEEDEQLIRYRDALPNLILTNYLEFRWFVDGERRLTATLGSVGQDGVIRRNEKDGELVSNLLQDFLRAQAPTIGSPKDLASRMAAKARLIHDIIRRAIETEAKSGLLNVTMEGLRRILISDLTREQFADIYAQTICYGLFAARCNHKGTESFTRKTAGYDLPQTNPFLREFFGSLAGLDLDARVVWAVDDLVDLLNHAAISDILRDFGRHSRREDPIVHFYETFLAEYDPNLRE